MAKFHVKYFHVNASARLEVEAEDKMEASCKAANALNNGQIAFGIPECPFHIEVMGPIMDVEIVNEPTN